LGAGLFKKGLGRKGKRRKEEEREGKGVRGREKRREGLTRMNNFISGLEIKSSICIFSDSEIYTNNTKKLVLLCYSIYRYLAYRRLCYTVWHRLGHRIRRVLPCCTVVAIRNTFPSSDGIYTGFKEI